MVYHDATKRYDGDERLQDDQIPFRIGIGMKYEEGHRSSVIVHFDGGECDDDSDAYLRLDEAVEIRDALSIVIADGMEAAAR